MTTGTPFTVVQARLSTSATDLLDRMAELHLAAPRGSQQEFQWIRSQAWGGGGGIERLYWLGDRSEVEFTSNDFQDLLEAGLVRRSTNSGRNTYRLPNDAVRFYRWRLEKAGPAPIQQMEAAVRSLLDDPAKLGRRHPEAARHLAAAFEWLWTDPLDDNALIETGGSLRSALTALTADLVGHATSPEKVVSALKPWLNEPGRLPPRHPGALVALIDWAVRCAQRLNHLHDERASGEPDSSWDEVRRTAFTVALICYELDRLTPQ